MTLFTENFDGNLRGRLQEAVSLADYSAWRVGGNAKSLYQPADIDDLAVFLQALPQTEPVYWLGLGSNTLVRDAGIKGTVIVTQGNLMCLETEGEIIRAQAGVACPALARFAARQALEGLEFLAGIPGTVGGALAMNAGCHGGETWEYVVAVETIDRQGKRYLRTPDEYQIMYRSVVAAREEWFVAGHFCLKKGDKEKSLERIRALLAHRTATQPTNEPNCGSVFRNPPGDFAARLIENCGLKGKKCGGAVVSTKHANFIINEGNASAQDIESLIEMVSETVFGVHGIRLMREVHILG